MPNDYASHRRFNVYALAGEGAGANDPAALTDDEADKAVVAYVWPEFTEVRLFPRDDFEQYATPFEHVFSSLLQGNAAPIVDETGELILYLGLFSGSAFRIRSDKADAFGKSGDLVPGYAGIWKWQISISSHPLAEEPGMSDPIEEQAAAALLALTTIDGTVMQIVSIEEIRVEDPRNLEGEALASVVIPFAAGKLIGRLGGALIRRLGVAALDYALAEDTIVELGTGRVVGSVGPDEMLFHLNRIEASSPELGQLNEARALTDKALQQKMRDIWAKWAPAGSARQVEYLPTKEMVARGVGSIEAPNLISLRPLAGNPRGLALINDMLLDPGFDGEFFDQTVHEMVANALGWSGRGGADVMAFIGDQFTAGVNTAQAILELSIKSGRSIAAIVNDFRAVL